jgi:preprotein translocase subunit SecF
VAGLIRNLYRSETRFDFIGARRRWYIASGVLLLICVLSFVLRGFNLGIEFSGGTQFQFKAPAAVSVTEVTDVVQKAGAEVPDAPQIVGSGDTRQFVVKTNELSVDQATKVEQALRTAYNQDVSTGQVSSSWGSDVTSSAIRALIVFLVLVCIFIAIRFESRMAAAAIVALIHDLVISAGVYSLVGFEVTPSTVVGLLTILGFSLYDTVVVFDKVDENTKGLLGGSRMTYSEGANLAVNQTLARSINTSLFALLPVGGLLFVGAGLLGVGTIKDLALVLFVGLLSGAYSSLFLATPVLCDLKEREPKWQALARRVAAKRSAQVAPAKAKTAKAPAKAGKKAAPAKAKSRTAVIEVDEDDDDLLPEDVPDDEDAGPAISAEARAAAASTPPRPGARPKRPQQQQRRSGGGRPAAKRRR